MEPCKDAVNTEFVVPAWAARCVSRNDQAFFEAKAVLRNVILYKVGDSELDFDIMGLPDKDTPAYSARKARIDEVQNAAHVVVPLTIQCLSPVSDLEAQFRSFF